LWKTSCKNAAKTFPWNNIRVAQWSDEKLFKRDKLKIEKVGGAIHRLDSLKVFDIDHLTLDEFPNNPAVKYFSKISCTLDPSWTYDCRLPLLLGNTRPHILRHKVMPLQLASRTSLPIALWNVLSCATVYRFRIADSASSRKSASGLPSSVSLKIASSNSGYF
jgi:hypothetical protein